MKPLTQTTATSGQVTLLTRMITDVGNSKPVQEALAGLDKDGAEKLKGNPEFVSSIREFVIGKISELSVSNQYANEEVASNYGYLSGYKPKGVTEQCNRLRELFPGLGYANLDLVKQIEEGKIELPAHAEGWFAIPNIWKKDGQPKIGTTYSECVQKVLNLIDTDRNGKFYNYRDGEVDEKHIRQLAKTKNAFEELSEAQGNPDILIVVGQFGIRHRGRSVSRAREVFTSNEFGLGAFVIGIMILTHRERLMNYDDLWIDCSGDEWSPDGDATFSKSPCLFFFGGKVKFGASGVDGALGYVGSASGFFPQAPQVQ